MKADELKGRELAAFLLGRASNCRCSPNPDGVDSRLLAAAEIERLCAEPIVIHHPPTPEYVEKSRRDAAALDEIAAHLTWITRGTSRAYALFQLWGNGSIEGDSPPDHLAAIIERTGRKIGA